MPYDIRETGALSDTNVQTGFRCDPLAKHLRPEKYSARSRPVSKRERSTKRRVPGRGRALELDC